MKFIRITYVNGNEYIPADGRWRGNYRATVLEDGRVKFEIFSRIYRYAQSEKSCFEYTLDDDIGDYILCDGQEKTVYGFETVSEYLRGAVNRRYSVKACTVDIEEVLASTPRDGNQLAYLLLDGQLSRAQALAGELTSDEKARVSYLNYAILIEDGRVLPRDEECAYFCYLMARAKEDVLRFLAKGYGKKVAAMEDFSLDGIEEKREYFYYKLLSETDYEHSFDPEAYALRWYLLSEERWNDKDTAEYLNGAIRLKDSEFWSQKRKYLALFQREAAEQLLLADRLDTAKMQRLVCFLGGYYAYLEKGNHDHIYTKESVNLGDEYDSDWVKEERFDVARSLSLIKTYAARGDAPAVRALALDGLSLLG